MDIYLVIGNTPTGHRFDAVFTGRCPGVVPQTCTVEAVAKRFHVGSDDLAERPGGCSFFDRVRNRFARLLPGETNAPLYFNYFYLDSIYISSPVRSRPDRTFAVVDPFRDAFDRSVWTVLSESTS